MILKGCMQWCETLYVCVCSRKDDKLKKFILVWSKQKLEKKAINKTAIARSWRSLTNEACVDSHEYMYSIVRHTVTVKAYASHVKFDFPDLKSFRLWSSTSNNSHFITLYVDNLTSSEFSLSVFFLFIHICFLRYRFEKLFQLFKNVDC